MKKSHRIHVLTRVVVSTFVLVAATRASALADHALAGSEVRTIVSATPLIFLPAERDSGYDLVSQGLDYGLFVDAPNATLVLRGAGGDPERDARLRFVPRGARAGVVVTPEEPLPGVTNVYAGSDPTRWRVGVPQFARVRCAGVYPGIDLVYYGSAGRLEYDFVLAPGADPRAIAFDLLGGEELRLDESGDLVVCTSAGVLVQHAPVAYQDVDGTRVAVDARYELDGTTVRFVVGHHDEKRSLVIDPVVSFSTFLGGSGGDQAWDFDVDPAGYLCVAGYTASANFPRTSGGALNGFWDMFVARFDPTASTLVYSTLLSASGSGTGVTEYATGVACDAAGNAYVTGRTNATDFPVLLARQPTNAGNTDAVLVKLDPSGQIVFSTYHGGSGNENGRYDSVSRCGKVAVDADRFVYVVGSTNSVDFPLLNALDSVVTGTSCAGGCPDMFLSKFSPDGQSLVFSTFIGDALPEEPVGLVVDSQRDVFVGGNNGTILIHKVASNGQSLVYSRSITNGPGGGSSSMTAFDVEPSGRVAITGTTSSGAYPTTPGVWRPTYTGCFSGTCQEAFVTILDADNGPVAASTYLGQPTYNESGTAIRFDASGDVVCAVRSQNTGGGWFSELWKFPAGLTGPLASFQLCGAGEATDLYVDAANNVRVVGWVWAGSSPASTTGAFQPTHAGNIDVFVSAYDMQSPPPSSPFVVLCVGDGSGASCPCGNESTPGGAAGCLHALGAGGKLTSSGIASLAIDTLVLRGTQMPNGPALYFQGTSAAGGGSGSSFGDGLRCATGSLVRLAVRTNVSGGSALPLPTETRLSVLGGITAPGSRTYQVWYRDSAAFCSSATFNLTNGGEIAWTP